MAHVAAQVAELAAGRVPVAGRAVVVVAVDAVEPLAEAVLDLGIPAGCEPGASSSESSVWPVLVSAATQQAGQVAGAAHDAGLAARVDRAEHVGGHARCRRGRPGTGR